MDGNGQGAPSAEACPPLARQNGEHQVTEAGGKPREIGERTLDYAVRAVKLSDALAGKRSVAGRVLGEQYLRAATSIGANVAEAQAGESRADFVHKLSIAQKEAREALYWLRVTERAGLVAESRLGPLIAETDEIVAVLTSIIVSAKKGRKK